MAELELAVDRPVALVAARLSDVAPDGAATRVSYGLLNLTHRESHEHPTALEPGRRYRVRLQLNDVAQAFPAGHRIRLALSTAYWPIAWPAPEPVTLTLYAGAERRSRCPCGRRTRRTTRSRRCRRSRPRRPSRSRRSSRARTERVVRHDVIDGRR